MVAPTATFAVTGIGLGLALRVGPSNPQVAFVAVWQMLPRNELDPTGARFLMSSPPPGQVSEDTYGGIPRDKVVANDVALNRRSQKETIGIPQNCVLFNYVVSVPVPSIPTPKLFPWTRYPFPLNRFARSRAVLAPVNSYTATRKRPGFHSLWRCSR